MSLDPKGLIADIGGTSARFAVVDERGYHDELVLNCADYESAIEAVRAYCDQALDGIVPKHASFAVAGAVIGDRPKMVNHLWDFSISETKNNLGFEQFHVINDFEAVALAVPHLRGDDVHQLGGGQVQEKAPIGVIGPGTGLGVASLFWHGSNYQAVAGEGGHVTMPALTQREFDIFAALRSKYSHVSAERVCSGKGLVNIYNTMRILDGRTDLSDKTPKDISKAALDQSCDICVEALDLMMGFLGTIAGNLALTLGAHGGIYIGGGIIEKLGDHFLESRFRDSFEKKGRLHDYLAPIPTFVIRHDYPAFVGLQADLNDRGLMS